MVNYYTRKHLYSFILTSFLIPSFILALDLKNTKKPAPNNVSNSKVGFKPMAQPGFNKFGKNPSSNNLMVHKKNSPTHLGGHEKNAPYHSGGHYSNQQGKAIEEHHDVYHARVYRHDSRVVPQRFKEFGINHFPVHLQRKNLLVTDRDHFRIDYPSHGPKGEIIQAHEFDRIGFGRDRFVRNHMMFIDSGSFKFEHADETQPNYYYWHNGEGFKYCHYYDQSGNHWYGWYLGDNYFWTRRYANNWWWNDPVSNNWCFWNDGCWYWQEPDSGKLFVYNNGNYISTEDNNTGGPSGPSDQGGSDNQVSPDNPVNPSN